MAKKRRAMNRAKAVPAARRRLRRARAEHRRKHKAIVAREKKLDAVKKRFSAAHRAGNKDLAEGDYAGVERAIRQEADAIDEFRNVTQKPLASNVKARSAPRVRRR